MAVQKLIVDDLIKAIYDAETELKFKITYDGTEYMLMDTFDNLSHMSMMFGGYAWYTPVFGGNVTSFIALFNAFITRNTENIGRQLTALLEDYNPIYNYDLTEQAADGSRRAKDTTISTPSGTMSVASAHTGTDTTTENRYGLDSSAGVPADKSTLMHGETVTDTTSFNQYKTETETTSANDQSVTLPDGNTATGYAEASEHYLRRFGNIGVQTAADILGGELALRVHDLACEWLMRFGNQYFVYAG